MELAPDGWQTGGMKTPRAIDSFSEIATARIELKDTDPPIWREVEVPTSITLKVLHDIVQATIGWMDYHLWEFVIDGRTYGLPMDEDWGTEPRKEAAKVRLRDVLKPGETVIAYTYDFGDAWEHEIRIQDIRVGEPGVTYPRYLAGERNGPPEDCGGVPGFYDVLDARGDPEHPEHADAVTWLDDYDPDTFDELPIKYALGRIAARRNAARARLVMRPGKLTPRRLEELTPSAQRRGTDGDWGSRDSCTRETRAGRRDGRGGGGGRDGAAARAWLGSQTAVEGVRLRTQHGPALSSRRGLGALPQARAQDGVRLSGGLAARAVLPPRRERRRHSPGVGE
jgi:hypothetical protein